MRHKESDMLEYSLDEDRVREICREEMRKAGAEIINQEPEQIDDIQSYPNHLKTVAPWETTEHHVYVGKPECRFLWTDWMKVTTWCIRKTDEAFPDREPIHITDSCSRYRQCKGHGAAHGPSNLSVWDGIYYSYEHVAGSLSDKLRAIWLDRDRHIINPNIFDWERQFHLFKMLKLRCINFSAMVDPYIWEYMSAKIKNLYGLGQWKLFFGLSLQRNSAFGHDTHFHVSMGNSLVTIDKLKQSLKG